MTNINSFIYGKLYFPVFSNSLKEIGAFIGHSWTEVNASGLESLVWRHQWDQKNHDPETKKKLINYNSEDCLALQKVFIFMSSLPIELGHKDKVSSVDDIKINSKNKFGRPDFLVKEFDYINKCAYFDYQRDKIFFRSTEPSQNKDKRIKRKRQNHKINKIVEIALPKQCPRCGHRKLYRAGEVNKVVINLKLFKFGMKKWVIKFSTHRAWCQLCKYRCRPEEFKTIREKYGHQVYAYIVYQRVAMKQSQGDIKKNLQDIFGFHVFPSWAKAMTLMADFYEDTYKSVLRKINSSLLCHADETDADVQDKKGYVWVFTSFEEVYYIYSPSREGRILDEVLPDFKGVLISDFYSAYNSVKCLQQKCLIHLIRDMNDDLHKHPFDQDYAKIIKKFGILLKSIVTTIDQYGLRKKHLLPHVNDVDIFYAELESFNNESSLVDKYRSRLVKNRQKLFEFLNHNDIPWNNNNAERAVKAFASYRNIVRGRFTEVGIQRYLVFLSIYQTCEYKNISFLGFLFSGETDIDKFNRKDRSSKS